MEKWIILISSILMLVFICWKEFGRKNKANLWPRVAASVLAVASLYVMILPISFQRRLEHDIQHSAVLLTEGFEKDSLNSLRSIPRFSTSQSIAAKNKNVDHVSDLAYFVHSRTDLNEIHILGKGLEQHELELFNNHKLIFHPSRPSGITAVHWNSVIRSGQPLHVQGSFNNSSNRPVKLLLKGLSTTLDSTEVTGERSFELNTIPKVLGRSVYSLIALSGQDTLANEKLPLIIEPKVPLKILILSSSPDFEYKFLKNWLYAENYAIAIRSTISKDKYSTEFLNIGQRNLNRMSQSVLKDFDIVIGDLTELSGLSAAESEAIQNEVSKGIGLVISADSAGANGFFRRAFTVRQNNSVDQKNLSLVWAGQKAKKIAAPGGGMLELVPRSGEQALVKDNKGHVLVGSKLYGAGRIIASTVSSTYTWMLSNNSVEYSSYWSHILDKAARKTESMHSWELQNRFPIVNYPSSIGLEYASANVPAATAGSVPLRFAQDPQQLYRWTAKYWPLQNGWLALNLDNKETLLYVYGPNDWLTVRGAERIKNTKQYISSRKNPTKQTDNKVRTYSYTIPPIIYFTVFLLCCAYLWAEKKYLRHPPKLL